MAKSQKKKKGRESKPNLLRSKDFLDMRAPAAVRFNTDQYILGGSYHCTLALRGYPTSTQESQLLRAGGVAPQGQGAVVGAAENVMVRIEADGGRGHHVQEILGPQQVGFGLPPLFLLLSFSQFQSSFLRRNCQSVRWSRPAGIRPPGAA